MNPGTPRAFPIDTDDEAYQGMELRDYLAARALEGLLSGANINNPPPAPVVCALSYQYADEMLVARDA